MKGGNRAAFGWFYFCLFVCFYVSILDATLFVCLLVSFFMRHLKQSVCIYYTQSDFFEHYEGKIYVHRFMEISRQSHFTKIQDIFGLLVVYS